MDTKEKLDWDQASKPPAYSEPANANGNTDQPPAYEAPTSFTIGAKTLTQPLVRIGELKAHLSLLGAFKNLRTLVEDGQITEWPEVVRVLDPSQRWAWFIGLAVDRCVMEGIMFTFHSPRYVSV